MKEKHIKILEWMVELYANESVDDFEFISDCPAILDALKKLREDQKIKRRRIKKMKNKKPYPPLCY